MGKAPAPSTLVSPSRTPQALAGLLMALAAASGMFWGLQISGLSSSEASPRFATQDLAPTAAGSSLAQTLGATSVASGPQSAPNPRMTLVAVMGSEQQGSALIALDGQKAQSYEVGAQIQGGRYLVRLGSRRAELGLSPQGPITETLTLPVPELPNSSK